MISQLGAHGEMLLMQYHERLPQLQQLADQVYDLLQKGLSNKDVIINSIEYRVKSEPSLIGKLERKGGKYKSIEDITDLVGIRVITYYTDDVDKVAAIVQRLFDIDWDNSVDKRKAHQFDSFGYNSLHYICRLKEGSLPFEMQIRTALQHVWSAIQHDNGYKGVMPPIEFQRQFSRLAGMMELIDDEFSRLRKVMNDYRRKMFALVKSGRLDEVPLSADTFRSYLEMRPFERLNQRIAAVNQAEIIPVPLMPYLRVLENFHLQTLEDVHRFIEENSENAYQLALSQLAVTDLDILSESVGIQNLCLVYMLKMGIGRVGVQMFFDMINGKQDGNAQLAAIIMEQAARLPFLQSSSSDTTSTSGQAS